MTAVVVYATRHGTTRRVAEAIAAGIRAVDAVEVRSVTSQAPLPDATDLLIVGGPTEAHRITSEMLDFLQTLHPDLVRGRRAAAFDTRLRWSKWLTGSAAETIGRRLELLGARAPVPTQSFFVTTQPDISAEELDRATAWGRELGEASLLTPETTSMAGGL